MKKDDSITYLRNNTILPGNHVDQEDTIYDDDDAVFAITA